MKLLAVVALGMLGLAGFAQSAEATTATSISWNAVPAVAVPGQSISFTVTVVPDPPGGTPTGNVTIDFGDGSPGANLVLSGGQATTTHTYTTSGEYTLDVEYGGDGTFDPYSTGETEIVIVGDTTTTMIASGPTVFGEPVTFTATVTASPPASGTPDGTVDFFDNGANIGTGTLDVSGQASLTTAALPVGDDPITATYSGSGQFNPSSTASATTQTVSKASTGTTLTSSGGPTTSGDWVTFTATVSATAPGSGTPSGVVTFKDGGADLGTGTLSGGVATLATPALGVGSRTVTAVYGGDGNFLTSTSAGLPQVVNKATSVAALGSRFNPSTFGQSVPFTATIGGHGGGAPTGDVSFLDGATTIGTVALNTVGAGMSLSTGANFTCALTAQGGVQCWGFGIQGQLGNGASVSSAVPVNVTGLASGVVAVSTGSAHACALTDAGGVQCWGFNSDGELGNGGNASSNVPVAVSGLASGVVAVSAGAFHTCALTDAGGVLCWGSNNNGKLGNGGNADSNVPVAVSGLTSGVVAIAAGGVHTCALTSAGGVMCWGFDGDGELGDGGNTSSNVPVAVSGLTSGVAAIAAGDSHACALTDAGGMLCWGYNADGELGDGGNGNTNAPVGVVGLASGVGAIAAGSLHTCALLQSGAAECWGDNSAGELGNGSNSNSNVPVAVTGLSSGVADIAPGGGFTCALLGSGSLQCWGENGAGELGDGTNATRNTAGPVPGLSVLTYAKAVFSTAALAVGGHTMSADYGGDDTHTGSTSPDVAQTVNQAATSAALSTSGSPSAFGQPVTFTATISAIAPSSGTPTGSVTFKDGATTLATVSLAGGVASLTTSSLAVGGHTITAVYGGDAGFTGATSSNLTQDVNQAASAVGLVGSPNPSVFGQSVTFTATVTAVAPATGTPTGSVTFKDGATTLGTVALAGGVASLTTASFSAGSHPISAAYSGDGNFTSATGSLSETVNHAGTTTSLVASPSPSVFGQPVTLTATIAVTSPGAGTPTGTVTFKDGSATIGTGTVASGIATLTTSSLAAGSHTLKAIYGGDGSFAASSGTFTQTVGKQGTTLTLTGPTDSLLPGEQLQLSVVVAAKATTVAGGAASPTTAPNDTPATPAPTGTVTFKDGATVLGTATLTNGKATFQHAALTIGKHVIAATYNGTQTFATSSATVTVVVDPKVGAEFRANTTVANAQELPSIARLADGGFVVVWQSNLQDGSGWGIYGQRYNAAGTRAGREFRVNTTRSMSQIEPSVAGFAKGGFVVGWTSENPGGASVSIIAQRFGANGAKVGGQLLASSLALGSASVATLKNNAFVVTWRTGPHGGASADIRARIYDPAGAPGPDFQVGTIASNSPSDPSVAPLGNGGFVVTWADGVDVNAERFGPVGGRLGGVLHVNAAPRVELYPTVGALGDGGFVVAWESTKTNGSDLGVFARRYAASGQPAAIQFRVDTAAPKGRDRPAVAGLASGGFTVLWSSVTPGAAARDVFGQNYDAAGHRFDSQFPVNTTLLKNQWQPAVAPLGTSGFVAAWTSRDQDGSLEGVYGQRFDTAP